MSTRLMTIVFKMSCVVPVPLRQLVASPCALQQLCTPQNVNCRDLEGRHSTPLHFAAGYNRVAVVEYLLHHGADVHAKDKGSVLYRPSSAGHTRAKDCSCSASSCFL